MPAELNELNNTADQSLEHYDTNLVQFRVLSAQVRGHNRAVLFDSLAGANIAFAIVSFDRDDEKRAAANVALIGINPTARLPAISITLPMALWTLPTPVHLDLALPQAIERLALDFLEHCCAVATEDRGNGTSITFNVAARLIAFAPRPKGKSHA